MRSIRHLATFAIALGGACTLDNPEAPELAGPSTLGRAIEIRAIPDTIVSDGFSSSVIEAILRGPNGERVSGVTIHFEIVAGGFFADVGNLAPLNGPRPGAGGVEAGPVESVTDGNGTARARYWAPFRTDQENDTTVTIAAREAGTNARGIVFAQADIFLRAANRPSFPGGEICSFIWEPVKATYQVGEGIAFTATQAIGDEGADCAGNEIARYEWIFTDDVGTVISRGTVHAFSSPGAHGVTLVTTEAITGCQSSCSATFDIVP